VLATYNVVLGTINNDVLHGTDGPDAICGGDDVLFGDGITFSGWWQPSPISVGNDPLYGGNGNDELRVGYGDDAAFGGNGDDFIPLAPGEDRGYGGNGDIVYGGWDDDTIDGGNGDDTPYGGQPDGRQLASDTDDTCDGARGTDSGLQCDTTRGVEILL
jgi:Ca2+-binding RTX toxin-like protein